MYRKKYPKLPTFDLIPNPTEIHQYPAYFTKSDVSQDDFHSIPLIWNFLILSIATQEDAKNNQIRIEK